MHELAITESIIGIVTSESERNGFRKVIEIRLKIGEYSGIVPECIRDFFPVAAKGTVAEGAKMITSVVPAVFSCTACGYSGPIDRKKACCPECGSREIQMTGGMELFIDSLKVE